MSQKRSSKKGGPVKRFGSRYGSKPRKEVDEIEKKKKQSYRCPRCTKKTLEWESFGVWKCRSCGLKLAGGAWTPITEIAEASIRTVRRSRRDEEPV